MSFSSQVRQFATQAQKDTDTVIRAITLNLFAGTVRSTPVDTGRLKGNWQVSQNAPVTGTLTTTDKSGAQTIANIAAGLGGWGSVTYLANNLPYAYRIEFDGWSHTKAPAGMVRINMARVQQHVRAAARQVK